MVVPSSVRVKTTLNQFVMRRFAQPPEKIPSLSDLCVPLRISAYLCVKHIVAKLKTQRYAEIAEKGR
jgi:hypothetical protein